jgi:hypothetical protein
MENVVNMVDYLRLNNVSNTEQAVRILKQNEDKPIPMVEQEIKLKLEEVINVSKKIQSAKGGQVRQRRGTSFL